MVKGHDLYLGLPTFTLRKKVQQFGFLLDKVKRKLEAWSSKLFSAAGKEVLLKSVIQAIPTYMMSCFRIPSSIINDIERKCAHFWWSSYEDKSSLDKIENFMPTKRRGWYGFQGSGMF